MEELIFHLGYPKTATKTLQNQLFAGLDSLLYLGKYSPIHYPEKYRETAWKRKLRRDYIFKDIPFFKEFDLYDFLQTRYLDQMKKLNKILISDESIFYNCMCPMQNGKLYSLGSIYNILDKIKYLTDGKFRKVKLIIVVRRQDSIVDSLFAERYERYKKFGLNDPNELASYIMHEGRGLPIESSLHYDQIIDYADLLFGRENVLAIPYELMKKDLKEYLDLLIHHIGIEINLDKYVKLISSNKENVRFKKGFGRKINDKPALIKFLANIWGLKFIINKASDNFISLDRMVTHMRDFITNFQKDKYMLMSDILEFEILNYFQDSNKRLLQRIPLIKEFGYFVG